MKHIETFFIRLVFKYEGRCVFIALVERITSRRETIWPHSTFSFYFSVAPQIRPVPHNGHLVVYQGDSATLSCDILKGNPTPEITWKRKVRNRKTFHFFFSFFIPWRTLFCHIELAGSPTVEFSFLCKWIYWAIIKLHVLVFPFFGE